MLVTPMTVHVVCLKRPKTSSVLGLMGVSAPSHRVYRLYGDTCRSRVNINLSVYTLATAIFSRPPSLAWHSMLLIHHSYNGEQSVLFARSNLLYSFSMQLRSIAASLGVTPVTQFRGRAASQFTVVVSRAGRPFTVKERQLVRNAICSCL